MFRTLDKITDEFGRPLKSLRVSVTDRCNLRCQYCMPEDEYTWINYDDILTFQEISELVDVFSGIGVEKVRLTGGEPLLRKGLEDLVRMLARNARIKDLSMTTNGSLMTEHAQSLYDAGLERITISLDTLRPDRFKALTRSGSHEKVLEGIEAALQAGFKGSKINTVVIRGYNDDEITDLITYGKQVSAEVRFIEYMDVGGATRWTINKVFSRREILETLERHYGPIEPLAQNGSAPADRYILLDGTVFGIIASTTTPFCRSCDRSRITADGMWYLCLYAGDGTDLKQSLRDGVSKEEIESIILRRWNGRSDRGAEERRGLSQRGILYPAEELKQDSHREMHTRGG